MNGIQKPSALHFCITRPNTQPGVVDRFRADLAGAVQYAKDHQGTAARSGAFYASGVTTDQIASGMSWWLDATQSVPPT
jgi:hypothetical protein